MGEFKMIKLKSLLEGRTTVPMVLYHLTKTEYLPSIKTNGLTPSDKGWVYLSDDEFTAQNYANGYDKGTSVSLLKINGRSLDISKLGPDDDDLKDILNQRASTKNWYDITWQQSLRLCSQMTYSGIILPRDILVEKNG